MTSIRLSSQQTDTHKAAGCQLLSTTQEPCAISLPLWGYPHWHLLQGFFFLSHFSQYPGSEQCPVQPWLRFLLHPAVHEGS